MTGGEGRGAARGGGLRRTAAPASIGGQPHSGGTGRTRCRERHRHRRSRAGSTTGSSVVHTASDRSVPTAWAPTAFLAHTCTVLEAVEHAETLAAALSSQPAAAVRVGPFIGWRGPVDHHVGSLCRVLRRLEEAETHLRRALSLEGRIGAPPFLARTKGELAQVLSLTGSPEADRWRAAGISEAEALGSAGRGQGTAPPDLRVSR